MDAAFRPLYPLSRQETAKGGSAGHLADLACEAHVTGRQGMEYARGKW